MSEGKVSERLGEYLNGRVPVCGAAIALIRDVASLERRLADALAEPTEAEADLISRARLGEK